MYVCMYVCKNNNLALDIAVAVETLHEPGYSEKIGV
jgi:hypothetical protein